MTQYRSKPPYAAVSDALSLSSAGQTRLEGRLDAAVRSLLEGLYSRLDFSKLVDFFRWQTDPFAAGEFWGKIVRSACLVWQYTGDASLQQWLRAAKEDLLSVQADNGCISTVPPDKQPNGTHGSDLWERKYVLLGLWAYWETFGEDDVLEAMCRCADHLCSQIGPPPKTPITQTGWAFCGIESSSILEPVMKLYNQTGRPQYLALARHIVEETGGCARGSIFVAIEQGADPRQVGDNGNPKESIAKAYEMMSCFEGLMEYYRATGDARWLRIARRFYERVRDREITLLGSGGADAPYNLGPGTGEQWNDTAREQTNPDIRLMMETCVTITWMKLCVQLLRLTGDTSIVDEFEKSLYNALLGALRPDGGYFDYFPPFGGTRGGTVNFTYDIGDVPLSCCTANGPAGLALTPFVAYMQGEGALAVQLYIPSRYDDGAFALRLETDYPADGLVRITVEKAPAGPFALQLRIPGWCEQARLAVNGEPVRCVSGGYAVCRRVWNPGDRVELDLGLVCRTVPAPHGVNRAGDGFFAVTYGPLLLARDKRFDPAFDQPLPLPEDRPSFTVSPRAGTQASLLVRIGGDHIPMVDYASAGATWDERSAFRSWLPLL